VIWIAGWAAVLLAAQGVGAYLYARVLERRFPPRGRRIDIGPGSIHCVETSAKGAEVGTVLLVHGASGNHADLNNALADRLAALGYRVFSVDRPGHAWSDRLGPRAMATSPEAQAEWIRAAIQRLGVKEAIVVVHSLAGALGLAMALNAPNFVRGLVLLAPASHPWPGGVSWYYNAATSRLMGPAFRWLLVPWAAQFYLRQGLAGVFSPGPTPVDYADLTGVALVLRPRHFLYNSEDVADFAAHVERLHKSYPNIRRPTAILTGDRDQVVYADIHSFGCFRDIPGATLRVLPNVGHSPHYGCPEEVIAAIVEVDRRAHDLLLAPQFAT
jgi:pimeloyl-ACP methyl ester carboxylesterase